MHVDIHAVAKEINGYFLADKVDPASKRAFKKGDPVPSFAFLQDDGSTSSGCWIYCNSYAEKGNMAARRGVKDPSGIGLYSEWAWSWPVNRRIIYNGASVDLKGNPWDTKRPVITWDGTKWVGDVPDGVGNPGSGRPPFIMKPDGVASIFGPGLADGPFPEHYEPLESPLAKNLLSPQMNNPVIKRWDKPGVGTEMDVARSADPLFPIVCTTMRVSEHWQSGVMTRWQPWLVEMQPALFVEISVELAEGKRGEERRPDLHQIGPRPGRGHSDGHRPAQALYHRREDRPSGRPSLAFRLGNFRDQGLQREGQEAGAVHLRKCGQPAYAEPSGMAIR